MVKGKSKRSMPAKSIADRVMTDTPDTSGMGRPSLPKTKRRSERVVTMVTTEEFAKLQQLSARRDQSISTTCRDLILKELERPNSEKDQLDK